MITSQQHTADCEIFIPGNAVMSNVAEIFSEDALLKLFPATKSDDFFDALFGDAEEGAFDIALAFDRFDEADSTLHFFLELHERPGRCLACNLTYGLPEVFSRHPIINVAGLVKDISATMGDTMTCEEWKLGSTKQVSNRLHKIPLVISVRQKE
ncbi:pancreas/duodenum homeobox protein 1 [Desulfogranum japonicum]|uniref:pancreas/duodenum homeobox protein 1 n=1 Tax=Desulfogranum japonicum TaxID=231447 RepID=UPI000415E916|nr:pancreas/duodenum homeobox protein 1 [Desulfogranum japonicum]